MSNCAGASSHPRGVRDLPVRLEQLPPAWQTYYTFTTCQTGHLDDTWVLPSTANRALEFAWTGETHFHIEDLTALPTRALKRSQSQTQPGKSHYPPGLQPAAVSTGAQASEDTQMDLPRTGAPGEQPPEVRVRLHDTALDSPSH